MRGQFLERATVIPTADGVLEALSHRGTRLPPLLIIPPPPGSGGMDHPVGAELAWAATRAHHATLRFNFHGVGASPGRPSPRAGQVADVEAAFTVLRANAGTEAVAVAALGASAATALSWAHQHQGVAGLALVSPADVQVEALASLGVGLLVVVGAEEAPSRAALSAAIGEAGGTLVVVPSADARFHRNLPEVGRAVVAWLAGLSASP